MNRRQILKLALLPVAEPLAGACGSAPAPGGQAFDRFFLPILRGFLRNSIRTSTSYAVCDFPQGTILRATVAKSGRTYTSVSRMLPAIAAWLAGGREQWIEVEGRRVDLLEVVAATFRNAFDPSHPDYWLPASPAHSDQRQVESSVVAWSLWLLRDLVLDRLTPASRTNVQNWLASCTQVPVRENNWAWFTAVNQAARISLSERWKEFSGDQVWMRADLEALGKMAAPAEGWYSDSIGHEVYDYYNFWVFHSHFLYWNAMVGRAFPAEAQPFLERTRLFLARAPYFFGGNGAHVLYGRSLIYRWGVLTPLVLAHAQKLWPQSPNLLRRIVRGNMDYFWQQGAFDESLGKLRETLAPDGTPAVREPYVDNGHPYWGMQAFALYSIPRSDPFWEVPEEPLPVEQKDFQTSFKGTRMMLVGTQRSGQVRWLHGSGYFAHPEYSDKYGKFSYSSHFPFNISPENNLCTWDEMLVFHNIETGVLGARAGQERGELLPDGVVQAWWAELEGIRIRVTSRIQLVGEFERRRHVVEIPDESVHLRIDAVEGSYPLGLGRGESAERQDLSHGVSLRTPGNGALLAGFNVNGYDRINVTESFGKDASGPVNLISPRMAVITLRAPLRAGRNVLESMHYASPNPLPRQEIIRQAMNLMGAPIAEVFAVPSNESG